MSFLGAGGVGCEAASFRTQTKESEGKEVSACDTKRLRGSLPVDENRETMLGWTAVANMVGSSGGRRRGRCCERCRTRSLRSPLQVSEISETLLNAATFSQTLFANFESFAHGSSFTTAHDSQVSSFHYSLFLLLCGSRNHLQNAGVLGQLKFRIASYT